MKSCFMLWHNIVEMFHLCGWLLNLNSLHISICQMISSFILRILRIFSFFFKKKSILGLYQNMDSHFCHWSMTDVMTVSMNMHSETQAFPSSDFVETSHMYFAILQETQNRSPRLWKCCMWLYLKNRGISPLPAPQRVWQPELPHLNPRLWTQSVACLSVWHQTYYGSFCLSPVRCGCSGMAS